jgi:hypothetical protein
VGGSLVDVVRGDLGTLQATGDFSAATSACLYNDESDTYADAVATPVPGQGFWYLVRTAAPAGTYDTGEPQQAGSRDAGIAASGNGCP